MSWCFILRVASAASSYIVYLDMVDIDNSPIRIHMTRFTSIIGGDVICRLSFSAGISAVMASAAGSGSRCMVKRCVIPYQWID